MKIPEYIIKAFGKTIEEIQKTKTTQPQKRETSFSELPVVVSMTPEECKTACKKAGVQYKDGYENRVLRYTCSDGSVDRMGDIVKQDGWMLENYSKNPVIMGFHNYGTFPVGNSLKTWLEDGKLKMHVLFADKDVSEDAEKAYKVAKSGFMKAGSVGFAPIEYKLPTKEEREELGMGAWGILFIKQDLLEFSVCGVPANANAIQESINKGIMQKKDWQGWIDEKIYVTLSDKQDEEEQKFTSTNDGHKHPYSVNDEGTGMAAEGETDHKHPIENWVVAETEGHTHTIPKGKSIEKPYPNEHACRLNDPGKYDKFRRGTRKSDGKEYSVIFGKKKNTDDWEQQAFRYDKDTWSADEAGTHCKDHDGTFEAASNDSKDCGYENDTDIKKVAEEAVKNALAQIQVKAGAVLSKKNKDSINKAIAGMKTAIEALEQLLKDAEKEPEDFQDDKDKSKSDEHPIIDIDLDALDNADEEDSIYTDETISIEI